MSGLTYAFRHERSLQIHFVFALFALGLCLFLSLSTVELLLVIFAICLVMMAEMLNTAVEAMVNLLTLEKSPFAKVAKDVAAGGVLVACLNALAVGYLVVLQALRRPLLEVYNRIQLHPTHLIPIIIGLILLVVIIVKSLGGRGQFTRGGIISGHAAVAAGVCTMVYLITRIPIITFLCLLLGFMVIQSRVEAKFHRIPEVVLGTLVGIFITWAVFYFFSPLLMGPR